MSESFARSWSLWIDSTGETKMDWPQCLDQNKQVIRTFRITAYPTYIVVDTEGIVRVRLQGLSPSTAPKSLTLLGAPSSIY